MRSAALALLLTGCVDQTAPLPIEHGVTTWAERVDASGGVIVAQVLLPAEQTLSLGEPTAEGLTFEARDEPRVERAGTDEIVTQSWTFTGDKDSYEIVGPQVQWGVLAPMLPSPLLVDVGVAPPRDGDLVGITEPKPIVRPKRLVPALIAGIAASMGLALLVGGVIMFAQVTKPKPPVVYTPSQLATRAWRAARADESLDERALAQAMSHIFREYVEAIAHFNATAWTTPEIVAELAERPQYDKDNPARAKRLLRATDRVKYAEAGTSEQFFDELEADLFEFIGATQGRRLGRETA